MGGAERLPAPAAAKFDVGQPDLLSGRKNFPDFVPARRWIAKDERDGKHARGARSRGAGFFASEFCSPRQGKKRRRKRSSSDDIRQWMAGSSRSVRRSPDERSDIRGRPKSLHADPGFHGACHRAGHFGPDPLIHPGYEGNTKKKTGSGTPIGRCSVTSALARGTHPVRVRSPVGVPPRL